jgi:hypothetical protein
MKHTENIKEKNDWRFIVGKQGKQNLIDMPKNQDFEVRYDDGTVTNFYDKNPPFAV